MQTLQSFSGITQNRRAALLLLCGSLCFSLAAHGEERVIDFDHCSHLKLGRTIVKKDTLTIRAFELFGIIRSNIEDKTFDNLSAECVNLLITTDDATKVPGYCTLMAPDGSYVVTETSCDTSGCSWAIIDGTDRFEGIAGTASFKPITQAKPISENNFQGCTRHTGTATLPNG